MAHKFSNFADAYTYLETRWSIAQSMQGTAYDMCDDADDYADAGNWDSAIHSCVYAIKSTLSAFDILLQNYTFSFDQSVFTECYYWASQEGGDGVIDMSAILDAVWKSTPLETFFFINDIDAMRAAIWNKEISETKLQELYRHFLI